MSPTNFHIGCLHSSSPIFWTPPPPLHGRDFILCVPWDHSSQVTRCVSLAKLDLLATFAVGDIDRAPSLLKHFFPWLLGMVTLVFILTLWLWFLTRSISANGSTTHPVVRAKNPELSLIPLFYSSCICSSIGKYYGLWLKNYSKFDSLLLPPLPLLCVKPPAFLAWVIAVANRFLNFQSLSPSSQHELQKM